MSSQVRFDNIFNYWWEDLKWSGVFNINWIFIKDVPHNDVKNIYYNNSPISSLKDGSEIDLATGKQVLEHFRTSAFVSDIFEYFYFMDEREKRLRGKRDSYYEVFKVLNERGFLEDVKSSEKKQNRQENRHHKNEYRGSRKNHRQHNEIAYERRK